MRVKDNNNYNNHTKPQQQPQQQQQRIQKKSRCAYVKQQNETTFRFGISANISMIFNEYNKQMKNNNNNIYNNNIYNNNNETR